MKFANLLADSEHMKNIGEDMQILAIENLYRFMKIDYENVIRIPVSQLRDYDGEKVVLPINYPFFGKFKISSQIIPVFLGLSILCGNVSDDMELFKYEPIGCRDKHSYEELKKYNIDAYLNGCLTAAFPLRDDNSGERTKVFLVDPPDKLLRYIPKNLLDNSETVTHIFFDQQINESFSKNLYERYKKEAKLIITSRLHCAMPCIAAGIPVVFACTKKSFRYTWLEKYVPIYEEGNFCQINWAPNPVFYEDFKNTLLENAAFRVLDAFNREKNILNIHKFYYMPSKEKYEIESLENAKKYVETAWKSSAEKKYILWGVTQTAELIFEYISQNYPEAILIGVIDNFHSQIFHGIQTITSESLFYHRDAVIFITAESANKVASELCVYLGIESYVVCWTR